MRGERVVVSGVPHDADVILRGVGCELVHEERRPGRMNEYGAVRVMEG